MVARVILLKYKSAVMVLLKLYNTHKSWHTNVDSSIIPNSQHVGKTQPSTTVMDQVWYTDRRKYIQPQKEMKY